MQELRKDEDREMENAVCGETMNLRKLYEEKQRTYQQLMNELNRVKAFEQQLMSEILRLEGELRLLEELIMRENKDKQDVIKAEDIC